MKPLRIAYFTHDSISEGVGRSQILALCQGLSDLGIEVNLYSFEKNQLNENLKVLTSSKSLRWTPFDFNRISFLGPFYRVFKLRQIRDNFDLIHARGDLPALAAVLRKKEPVLWDIRSLWSEQKRILNPRKFNPITLWVLHRINHFISRRVSSYNTLTLSIMPYLTEHFPDLPDLHATISTCVDTNSFAFSEVLPCQPQALLSGTYNKIYDNALIERFNSYMRSTYQHKVVWAKGNEADSRSQDLGHSEIIELTYDEMPSIIRESSYGIAVCKNGLGASLSAAMPTKIAEFLAIGRPVVVNSNLGDVQTQLIEKGVAIALNDIADIPAAAAKLIQILEDTKTPERCRRVAEEYFSLATALRNYVKLYKSMLSSQSELKKTFTY